jgi:hypothetical protein
MIKKYKYIFTKNIPNISKKFNFSTTSKINTYTYLHEEKQINKTFLIFYISINAPFYLLSMGLGHYDNLFSNNIIDYTRLGIRSYMINQAVISGFNISSIIKSTEVSVEKKLVNKSIEETPIIVQELKNSNMFIYLAFLPTVINFSVTQVLLNSVILTNDIIALCLFGYVTSNVINILIAYTIVSTSGTKMKSVLSSSYFKINLLIAILNLISIMLFIKYIQGKNKDFCVDCGAPNPLKRINDEFRLENLENKSRIIVRDDKKLEEEYEGLDPGQMEVLEEIFKD